MCMHTFTYNGILLSHKNNDIVPFAATWMDPEDMHLVKQVRQEGQMSLTRGILKIIPINLHIKQKQIHRYRKQTYGYQSREGGKERQIKSMELTDTK